jgi:hypothetical protein
MVSGKVVGPDGKPVMGALVVIDPDFSTMHLVTLTTDRSGRFKAEVQPRGYRPEYYGRACIYAPGFALAGGFLEKGENVFRLQEPGRISGMVQDERGRRVPGARVTVQVVSDGAGRPGPRASILLLGLIRDKVAARADGQGRWTILALPASGKARLLLDDARYVHTTVEAELGPEAPAPPAMIARPGATIIGRVVYEGGKSAKGIRVFAQGQGASEGWSDTTTGADGSYRLASLAQGVYNVEVDEPSGKWVAAALEGARVKTGQVLRAADLVLTTGGIVEGTVTDSATGRPLEGAWICSYGPHRPRSSAAIITALTDRQGRYRLRVAPGESYIYVSGPKGYPSGDRGVEVTVAKGQTKALDFRLAKEPKVAMLTARGRVVDQSGEPVVGATVHLNIMEPVVLRGRSARMGLRADATTDKDGRFLVPDVRADATVSATAEKTGYKWVSGGEVRKTASSIEISDIVLTAPGKSAVQGRVVDEKGAPVAGARVMSPDGDPDEIAAADASGNFSIDSLPEDEVRLVAVHDSAYGDAQARVGGPQVTITLAPPKPLPGNDVQRGYAILADVWKRSAGARYYARNSLPVELAPYDADLALKLAQATGESVPDEALSGVVVIAAEADPTRAATWAPAKLEQIKDPAMGALTAAYLGMAVASVKPDLAAELYAKATQMPVPQSGKQTDLEAVFMRWPTAALAVKLHREEARSLVEQLMTEGKALVAQGGEQESRGLLPACVELLAKASPELAEEQAMKLTGRDRTSALADAVEQVAQYDGEAAYRIFARIEPPMEVEQVEAHYYGVGAKNVILAIGKSKPGLALEVARKVTDKGQLAAALALAAQFQEKALCRELFREAAVTVPDQPGKIAWFAAMAYGNDRELGGELFAGARKAVATDSDVAQFAFYYSQVDPAESRLMMERQFARRKKQGPEHGSFRPLVAPVLAMAACDFDRALELAQSIPASDPNAHFDALRKLAQYALAPEPVRRIMPFDRWSASDTWRPGTPTGW